jgi:hypothetical protein
VKGLKEKQTRENPTRCSTGKIEEGAITQEPAEERLQAQMHDTRRDPQRRRVVDRAGATRPAPSAVQPTWSKKASRGMTGLVQLGLAQRIAANRRNLLAATDHERGMYAELFPQIAQINRRLIEVLDDAEANLLERTLDKLLARAVALYEEGGGVDARANRRRGGSRKVRAMGPSVASKA